MDVVKTLSENIEKLCKYIPFAVVLLCISVSSFLIYFLDISNVYFDIGIYSGSLFLGFIIKFFVDKIKNLYIKRKLSNSKWLTKVWDTLSKDEQNMLKAMYESDKSLECDIDNRTALLLQQKGMILHPTQRSDGFHITYIMNPWVEKMVKENISIIKPAV